MTTVCPECKGVKFEQDSATGALFCLACGTVLEESQIVSEVTFGESSTGAAIVQGSYIAAGQAHAGAARGPFGKHHGSLESREQTLANGKRRIINIANKLKLPEHLAETGFRWFTLAVSHNFVQGRRSHFVAAACLYVACRQAETNHMLIDFADALRVSVFSIGATYLKLIHTLQIKRLPLIDPSIYIQRFAVKLEFGEKVKPVMNDAVRLVQRMGKDWIHQGRRPAGVAGACILVAARMNNFRRSKAEVVHLAKVAEDTIQRRLDEFSTTEASKLSIHAFRGTNIETSANPPSFKEPSHHNISQYQEHHEQEQDQQQEERDRQQEERERQQEEQKRQQEANSNQPTTEQEETQEPQGVGGLHSLAEVAAAAQPAETQAAAETKQKSKKMVVTAEQIRQDEEKEQAMSREMDATLQDQTFQEISENAEKERMQDTISHQKRESKEGDLETLSDVDDDEIDFCMLNEDEVELKSRIWMGVNREYLIEQESKRLKLELDAKNGVVKQPRKRRKYKPRDSSRPDLPPSPAASAMEMLQSKSRSKKINYDALKHLFN